ncbi:MAG TPA: hypothetical protein VFL59_07240 [Candidatus Nanopelagicales bacterium]|nr:hypothetical protein [Candidatus Nanopelagicales bacterium]
MDVDVETRALRARESLRLSAVAWAVLVLGTVAAYVAAPHDQLATAARVVAPLVVIAFVVLALLAVRRAWQGRGSGSPASTWAGVVAVVDAVALLLLLLSVAALVWLLVTLSRCGDSCFVF